MDVIKSARKMFPSPRERKYSQCSLPTSLTKDRFVTALMLVKLMPSRRAQQSAVMLQIMLIQPVLLENLGIFSLLMLPCWQMVQVILCDPLYLGL